MDVHAESRDAGCEAAEEVLKPCTAACFKAQLDHYHLSDPPDGAGLKEDSEAHAGVFDGSSDQADSIIANQAKTGVSSGRTHARSEQLFRALVL